MATNPTIDRPLVARRRSARLAPYRRERQQFGGCIQWEAVFFGLLAGIGFAASLVAMVLGGLIAAGVTNSSEDASGLVDHLATSGGAIAVAILALGFLTAGYVAARMARFDGWRQGLGVWLLSVLIILAAAAAAWIGGGEPDPTKSISLPSNPIDDGPLGEGWGVLVALALVVPLIFAVVGGVLGERFHRTVDRVGFEPEPESELAPEPEDEPETVQEDEESRPVVSP